MNLITLVYKILNDRKVVLETHSLDVSTVAIHSANKSHRQMGLA